MRVFLSGDYAFLYQKYGLSGSSGMLLLCKIVLRYYSTSTITCIGRHCCQLCEIPSDSFPGLHITLGVFHRLFTLFEDECDQLDLQLAELTNPQAGDRSAYCSHSKTVHEERKLLDARDLLEDEIKWLEQTTSYLTLNSANPSTNPTLLAVLKRCNAKYNFMLCILL